MIRLALLVLLVLVSSSGVRAQVETSVPSPTQVEDAPGAAAAGEQDAGSALAPAPTTADDAGRAVAPEAATRGETALARRLSDSVAVRIGPQRLERVLYYFSPTAELAEGDELEQGSGGHSEIGLPEGGRVQLHSTAHLVVEALGRPAGGDGGLGGDVLVFPLLTKARITSFTRPLTVIVPGGANCSFQGTEIEVLTEPGRVLVRNQGGLPVEVLGLLSLERGESSNNSLSGVGRLILERGQEVVLPLFRLLPVGRGGMLSDWDRLTLRHDGGWVFEESPGVLRVSRPEDLPEKAPVPADDLTIQGVRARAIPGEALLVSNRRSSVADPLLSLADLAPDEESDRAGLPIGNQFLLSAVRKGVTLEQLRADGYEVSDKLYTKAVAHVKDKAAAAQAAKQANDNQDSPTENTEDDQP